jgi:hypothetical protein
MTNDPHPGSVLRTVNERLLDREGESFLCECGARRCSARITVGRAEFERYRQVEGARIVARGHWRRGERVIFATSGYLLITD